MTKNEFNYNSKEELINDFIRLFRDQHKERKAYIGDFAKANNIDPELDQSHWPDDLEDEFYVKFNRAKLPAWTKYKAFMHGIPFEDLVMLERLIGHHDVLVDHDMIMYDQDNPKSMSYITKGQRWTVMQYIDIDVLRTADLAEKHLAELKEAYPDDIESTLTSLIPVEFRESS